MGNENSNKQLKLNNNLEQYFCNGNYEILTPPKC